MQMRRDNKHDFVANIYGSKIDFNGRQQMDVIIYLALVYHKRLKNCQKTELYLRQLLFHPI